jgi:L-fuculose-phosphate aldolase
MTAPDPPAAPEPVQDTRALRETLIATARRLNAAGLNVNKAGNVSARCRRGATEGLLITPTGVGYDALVPDRLVFIRLSDGQASGTWLPSSEWRFHRDILAKRPEFGAVVHTHSHAATALATHGRGIPSFHYMVAAAGGSDIRCAPYSTFGTQQLSDNALAALNERRACLLAHHGVIACGTTLDAALSLAIEVEFLAQTYLSALVLGEPPRLSDAEMQTVRDKFAQYGQPMRTRPAG